MRLITHQSDNESEAIERYTLVSKFIQHGQCRNPTLLIEEGRFGFAVPSRQGLAIPWFTQGEDESRQ